MARQRDIKKPTLVRDSMVDEEEEEEAEASSNEAQGHMVGNPNAVLNATGSHRRLYVRRSHDLI